LSFAPDDSRHPVFRPFAGVGTLGHVVFTQAAVIDPPRGAVIARYSDGSPALVEEGHSGGRILIFASDLNNRWNDFPMQPTFVPFVHEALRYLAAQREARAEYLVGELAGARGAATGVVALGGRHSGGGRRAAINIDPRESDPARMAPDLFQAGISRGAPRAAEPFDGEARREEESLGLWRYGLLLVIVALSVEGMLGRRLG
jgi:hypothetical protein